jgi:hypothetical protein
MLVWIFFKEHEDRFHAQTLGTKTPALGSDIQLVGE